MGRCRGSVLGLGRCLSRLQSHGHLADDSPSRNRRTPPAHARTASQRIRRPGAGRPRLAQRDPRLLEDLQCLLEPVTRGDPESPLLWTSKSTRHLAEELVARGHQVSHDTVGRLLDEIGYSLQANRKTLEERPSGS